MGVEYLNKDRIKDFILYCKKYIGEIDESFLYDEALENFQPDEENPTYVIVDNEEKIVATASLMINDYSRRGKKARFRIFHSETHDIKHYNSLLRAILCHTDGLDNVYIFVPYMSHALREGIEKLNFSVERQVFFLLREDQEVKKYKLPKHYEIKDFRPGIDEAIFCEIRNRGFANLKGNETPITLEMAEQIVSGEDYIDGGVKILYHNDKPVGVVRGSEDDYEGLPVMTIGPLAIIPEYQGKGLGRMLLRASLEFAHKKGYKGTVLCVNEENEGANKLYIQEGFKQVEGVTCYTYGIDS